MLEYQNRRIANVDFVAKEKNSPLPKKAQLSEIKFNIWGFFLCVLKRITGIHKQDSYPVILKKKVIDNYKAKLMLVMWSKIFITTIELNDFT